ncbi:hypothetical protein C8J56DRAFT_888358 [Mycena floridula]|nr:hypothetical protein C8J56DRAFT_888358 [Mycena floridula]
MSGTTQATLSIFLFLSLVLPPIHQASSGVQIRAEYWGIKKGRFGRTVVETQPSRKLGLAARQALIDSRNLERSKLVECGRTWPRRHGVGVALNARQTHRKVGQERDKITAVRVCRKRRVERNDSDAATTT